jgi:PEP-CTERM motif
MRRLAAGLVLKGKSMIHDRNFARAVAAVLAIGLAGSAQASGSFHIDPNPDGAKLNLTGAKDVLSSFGSVINYNDVAILADANVDFAHGYANITPVTDGTLTSLLFTPVDSNAFNGFSFRGQTHFDDTVMNITVQDNQGNAPEIFSFTIPQAHQSFDRIGIIASFVGTSIKWVEVSGGEGFSLHDIDHMDFNTVNGIGAVPEPASWAMMIAGFGLAGASLRRRRIKSANA